MNSTKGSIMPFVLGAGVGALVALLLSPKTGEDLRSDIAEGVSEGGRQIGVGGRKIKERMEKIAAQAQDHIQDAVEAGQNAYKEASNA